MTEETKKIKNFVQNLPSIHFLNYELCSALRNFIDSWNMCNKIQYKDDPYVWIIGFEKPREIRSQIIAEKESPNFDNRSNTSIS